MTLTVPLAGTTAGRTANTAQFVERPTVGDDVAQLGQIAQAVGQKMTADRLRREQARNQTDLTKSLNDLRLQVDEIGDPDAKEQTWSAGIQGLRGEYLEGDDGTGRVSIQNRPEFEAQFDDLSNRLSYGIGAQVIETRKSQDRATLAQYGQEASVAASQGADAGVRETLYRQGNDQIDRMIGAGVLTPEEGEAQRQALRASIDAPAAATALEANPAQLASDIEAGQFAGLSGSDRVTLRSRANTAVAERSQSQLNAIAMEAVDADPGAFLDEAEAPNSPFRSLPPETLARHRIAAGQAIDAQARVQATADAITIAGFGPAEYLARDANGEFADLPADEQARRRVEAQDAVLDAVERIEDDNLRGRAISTLGADPAEFLDRNGAGEFDAIPADQRAIWANQAQTRLETEADERLRAEEKARAERQQQIGTQLETYVSLAGTDPERAIAIDRDFLSRPDVQAHPDYPRVRAALELRGERGAWQRQTPAGLAQIVASEADRPVVYKYQDQRREVAQEALDRATEGWSARPIGFAAEVGFVVPDLDLSDPAADPAELTRQMTSRFAYAVQMQEAGYTARPVAFSDEDRERLDELTGPQADPAARLALAEAAQAAGIPPSEMSSDRLFVYAQGSLGDGMARPTVQRMMRGQAIIEENNIVMPPVSDRLGEVYTQVAGFFADLPGGERLQADAIRAADALYATRRRMDGPGSKEIDTSLYRQAIHEALGGTGPYNDDERAQGGLQTVRDVVTVLPRGVTGDAGERCAGFPVQPSDEYSAPAPSEHPAERSVR